MEIKVEEYTKRILNQKLSVQELVYKSANDVVHNNVMDSVKDVAEDMYDTDAKKVIDIATSKLNEKMGELL